MDAIPIDKAGRVVIPKEIRDEYNLQAGDALEISSDGQTITLKPRRASAPLRKERGIWVYQGTDLTAAETEALVDEARG